MEVVAMSHLLRQSMILLVGVLVLGCTKAKLAPLAEVQIIKPFDAISLEIGNYKVIPGREFRHLFVSNFSVKVTQGGLEYSTARDGLHDKLKTSLEAEYGFTTDFADWNGDGFSDLLMFLSGITVANQSTLFCGPQQRLSSSNDSFVYMDNRQPGAANQLIGLRDCEKVFLQLNPAQFDFDKDGIPDYLEVRNGLNPKNASDANANISADGLSNIEKVKRNIPIDLTDKLEKNQTYAYDYKTEIDSSGTRTFNIKNIPVLRGGIENFLAFYLIETDAATQQDYLYTAYMIIDRASAEGHFKFPFWASDPSANKTNQEILE
jgi:hypothetical protein